MLKKPGRKKEKEMETKRMLQEKQAELDAGRITKDIALEEERKNWVDLQTENEKKRSDAKAYDSEVLLRTLWEWIQRSSRRWWSAVWTARL